MDSAIKDLIAVESLNLGNHAHSCANNSSISEYIA